MSKSKVISCAIYRNRVWCNVACSVQLSSKKQLDDVDIVVGSIVTRRTVALVASTERTTIRRTASQEHVVAQTPPQETRNQVHFVCNGWRSGSVRGARLTAETTPRVWYRKGFMGPTPRGSLAGWSIMLALEPQTMTTRDADWVLHQR